MPPSRDSFNATSSTLIRRSSSELLERILVLVSLALGGFHAWAGRYSMNPDGMSYLDVGDSFFRQDWFNAVNAWWSPLYPWTVGLILGMGKPSTRGEFPLVHLVNFGIFVAALFAFRFLLQNFLQREKDRPLDVSQDSPRTLPDWALVLLAYPIFWWIALEVETVYVVSPDLAVLACTCLSAGMLLHLTRRDTIWNFALFGLILGLGYWTKAILFPLGFVALGVGYLWKRSVPGWRRGMAVATIAFICCATPLIASDTHEKLARRSRGQRGSSSSDKATLTAPASL